MKNKNLGPVVMVALDGWGIAPDNEANAITQAQTPIFDHLVATYPSTALRTSGDELGYHFHERPEARVGYFCLGTGGAYDSALFRINKAIDNKSFFQNKILLEAIEHVKINNSKLHLVGLASQANIHSSFDHLQALIKLAADSNVEELYLHLILDGIDSASDSGIKFVERVESYIKQYGGGVIATISGRFYALDRDNHWNRTAKFYNALIKGEGRQALSAKEAIKESYNKHIFDKELYPTVIFNKDRPQTIVDKDDSVVFFNLRGDRLQQITKALSFPKWEKIPEHKYLKNSYLASLTEVSPELPIKTAFPAQENNTSLGGIFEDKKIKQYRISSPEKFGLLTYDFNGCRCEPFNNESREIISKEDPLTEEINKEVITRLLNIIKTGKHQFILANFANLDRAASKYDMSEMIKIIEAVDSCLGKIIGEIKNRNGALIITSPFGKIEEMYDLNTNAPLPENSYNNTPLIIAGNRFEGVAIEEEVSAGDLSLISSRFSLIDVAPTILNIMGIPKPGEMNGQAIL
jgi:2,3-bisphosphoglycerate-independent phosphoglycerate mutase